MTIFIWITLYIISCVPTYFFIKWFAMRLYPKWTVGDRKVTLIASLFPPLTIGIILFYMFMEWIVDIIDAWSEDDTPSKW